MGCKNCKQQETQNNELPKNNEEVGSDKSFIDNVMEDSSFDGGFLLKFVVFVVVTAALPFIVLVLAFQLFIHFFLPNSVYKIHAGVKKFFKRTFGRYVKFVHDQEIKKREKQFSENRGYDEESDLTNIEVYEDREDNKIQK